MQAYCKLNDLGLFGQHVRTSTVVAKHSQYHSLLYILNIFHNRFMMHLYRHRNNSVVYQETEFLVLITSTCTCCEC